MKKLLSNLILGVILFLVSIVSHAEVIAPDQIQQFVGPDGKVYITIIKYSDKVKRATIIKKFVSDKYEFLFYLMPLHKT